MGVILVNGHEQYKEAPGLIHLWLDCKHGSLIEFLAGMPQKWQPYHMVESCLHKMIWPSNWQPSATGVVSGRMSASWCRWWCLVPTVSLKGYPEWVASKQNLFCRSKRAPKENYPIEQAEPVATESMNFRIHWQCTDISTSSYGQASNSRGATNQLMPLLMAELKLITSLSEKGGRGTES